MTFRWIKCDKCLKAYYVFRKKKQEEKTRKVNVVRCAFSHTAYNLHRDEEDPEEDKFQCRNCVLYMVDEGLTNKCMPSQKEPGERKRGTNEEKEKLTYKFSPELTAKKIRLAGKMGKL